MNERKSKIVMLGNFSVGKTSLTNRYVNNIFSEKYVATLGVRVSKKILTHHPPGEVERHTLLIWDINGTVAREEISVHYLRGAAGAVIVADPTRPETLADAGRHIDGFLNECPGRTYVVAVNKVDLLAAAGLQELRSRVASESWGERAIYTSALTGEGVDSLFAAMAEGSS